MSPAIFFLTIPSALILIFLIVHSLANRGRRKTLVFFIAAVIYGIVRASLLQSLITKQYGTLFPYLINFPVIKIGAVSLQEIVGWSVAATLAWLLSDRFLRLLRMEPTPHRTALGASICLAAICLSVETAAIESGWWIWTIKQPHGIFGRVPLVGLMDWGFVAFDFLLPYLLWTTPAPIIPRLIGLSLFPVHFLFHPKTQPLPEPLPLAWNDLVHALILCYVLVRSIGEKGRSALPDPRNEKLRWIPLASVMIIVLATSLAVILIGKNYEHWVASLPLLLIGLTAYVPKTKSILPAARKPRKETEGWITFLLKLGAVFCVFCFVYAFRAPFNRRTQLFVENMKKGIEYLNRGDVVAAEEQIRKGIQARPDQSSGRAILAHLLLRKGDLKHAREQLEIALDLNHTQQTALILLTTLDLMEKKWDDASQRAMFGRRLYPERPEFIYQQAVAQHQNHQVAEALDAAKRGGVGMIQALANVALALGDQNTAETCRNMINEMQNSRKM